MPRLAAELAQPTPGGPKRAPFDVRRVTLACWLGPDRERGLLSHLRVAQLSVSVAGPPLGHATISLYLVFSCLGWGMEASPGVNVSVPDLPGTHLARGGRSITWVVTRGAYRPRAAAASAARGAVVAGIGAL